jgi:hypothetical protein
MINKNKNNITRKPYIGFFYFWEYGNARYHAMYNPDSSRKLEFYRPYQSANISEVPQKRYSEQHSQWFENASAVFNARKLLYDPRKAKGSQKVYGLYTGFPKSEVGWPFEKFKGVSHQINVLEPSQELYESLKKLGTKKINIKVRTWGLTDKCPKQTFGYIERVASWCKLVFQHSPRIDVTTEYANFMIWDEPLVSCNMAPLVGYSSLITGTEQDVENLMHNSVHYNRDTSGMQTLFDVYTRKIYGDLDTWETPLLLLMDAHNSAYCDLSRPNLSYAKGDREAGKWASTKCSHIFAFDLVSKFVEFVGKSERIGMCVLLPNVGKEYMPGANGRVLLHVEFVVGDGFAQPSMLDVRDTFAFWKSFNKTFFVDALQPIPSSGDSNFCRDVVTKSLQSYLLSAQPDLQTDGLLMNFVVGQLFPRAKMAIGGVFSMSHSHIWNEMFLRKIAYEIGSPSFIPISLQRSNESYFFLYVAVNTYMDWGLYIPDRAVQDCSDAIFLWSRNYDASDEIPRIFAAEDEFDYSFGGLLYDVLDKPAAPGTPENYVHPAGFSRMPSQLYPTKDDLAYENIAQKHLVPSRRNLTEDDEPVTVSTTPAKEQPATTEDPRVRVIPTLLQHKANTEIARAKLLESIEGMDQNVGQIFLDLFNKSREDLWHGMHGRQTFPAPYEIARIFSNQRAALDEMMGKEVKQRGTGKPKHAIARVGDKTKYAEIRDAEPVKGLVAILAISKNELVTFYLGVPLDAAYEFIPNWDTEYMFLLPPDIHMTDPMTGRPAKYIDAGEGPWESVRSFGCARGRYANSSVPDLLAKRINWHQPRCNAKIKSYKGWPAIVACEDIKPEQEVAVFYGADYFQDYDLTDKERNEMNTSEDFLNGRPINDKKASVRKQGRRPAPKNVKINTGGRVYQISESGKPPDSIPSIDADFVLSQIETIPTKENRQVFVTLEGCTAEIVRDVVQVIRAWMHRTDSDAWFVFQIPDPWDDCIGDCFMLYNDENTRQAGYLDQDARFNHADYMHFNVPHVLKLNESGFLSEVQLMDVAYRVGFEYTVLGNQNTAKVLIPHSEMQKSRTITIDLDVDHEVYVSHKNNRDKYTLNRVSIYAVHASDYVAVFGDETEPTRVYKRTDLECFLVTTYDRLPLNDFHGTYKIVFDTKDSTQTPQFNLLKK